MPHPSRNNGERHTTKRARRLRFIGVVILLGITAGILGIASVGRDRRSADERLAEIEAARAVPDAENAAGIYNELMGALLDDVPSVEQLIPDEKARERVLCEPWHAEDYPELVAWIERQQVILARLAEAARFEQCRFPIPVSTDDVIDSLKRAIDARRCAEWLAVAAQNDFGEGRVDAALAKCRCLSQLANHFRQQPLAVDHLMANSFPMFTWASTARLVIAGNPSETQLQTIEVLAQPLTDRWPEYLREIRAVEDLQNEDLLRQYGLLKRVKFRPHSWFANLAGKGQSQACEEAGSFYLTDLAMARGLRLFVALKRYRNATGRWPEKLDEIKASLPAEALQDPSNKRPFIYRPRGDSFRLYSSGPNRRDESIQRESESGDDWPIWPPRKRQTSERDENDPNRQEPA